MDAAAALALYHVIVDMEALEYHRDMREFQRATREINHPFDLSDNDFRTLFRVTPDMANDLINDLYPYLQRLRSYGMSVEEQVLKSFIVVQIILYQKLTLFNAGNFYSYCRF